METDKPQTRNEILTASLEARVQEVMFYQINIDNYTLAIAKIESLPADEQNELAEFANQLRGLLASEKLEQKKARIMLDVLKQQVEN